jgi:hypothetical protein
MAARERNPRGHQHDLLISDMRQELSTGIVIDRKVETRVGLVTYTKVIPHELWIISYAHDGVIEHWSEWRKQPDKDSR